MSSQEAEVPGRPLVAGTTHSRRWPTADTERSGNQAEGLLPGFASNSPSRPSAALRDALENSASARRRMSAFRRRVCGPLRLDQAMRRHLRSP